jgi:3-methyladenine DNA glycosylase/8-oxoguanine DNA glycosylase
VPSALLRRTQVSLPRDDAAADAEAAIPLSVALDLPRTLAPVVHGHGDPTIRVGTREAWRAWRTAAGPAALRVYVGDGRVEARAWGPGADEAIGAAAALIGLHDSPETFAPADAFMSGLVHRFPGLRLPSTGDVLGALVPAILEQKVTGIEARRTWRALLRQHGETAPGPAGDAGMRIAPDPATLAAIPSFTWHRLGIERRRATLIGRVAREADRLQARAPERVSARLRDIPGIGPWTIAEVARVAWGDPDAVSVGDYHLPSLVSWALAGEPRADDARMLELLAPYAGQRGRVQRLLEASGIRMPRYGPRMTPGDIRGI